VEDTLSPLLGKVIGFGLFESPSNKRPSKNESKPMKTTRSMAGLEFWRKWKWSGAGKKCWSVLVATALAWLGCWSPVARAQYVMSDFAGSPDNNGGVNNPGNGTSSAAKTMIRQMRNGTREMVDRDLRARWESTPRVARQHLN
jgi:hypothetical protein